MAGCKNNSSNAHWRQRTVASIGITDVSLKKKRLLFRSGYAVSDSALSVLCFDS